MSLAAQTFVAAESRPLALKRRPDLRAVSQRLAGERYWMVKDPASLKYFQLSEEEHFLLEQLDGHTSLDQIQARFERQFAPRRIEKQRLHGFVGTLHREGLLIGDAPGQADVLLERRREQTRRELVSNGANLLALRFRGVDPQPLLDWLYPKCRWMFSRTAFSAAFLFILAAITLVAVRHTELAARLPEFREFFGGRNLIWLGITLAIVKVLHELGHALACKHFGGECHEIGLMLLVFMPCLYCNVSDAWMLPNKWHRAAIAAAGIGVELLLAAAATFLWWSSEPGRFNAVCLDVMVICSVSTLVFNGNPLLRYDGYYVLSDLLEIPNLQQRAADALRNGLAKFFLGLPATGDRLYGRSRHRGWLAAYGVASFAYRLIVVSGVLWALHLVLKPHHLENVAVMLAVVAVGGIFATPALRAARFTRNPRWRETIDRRRFTVRGAIVAALLAGLFFAPLPARVSAPLVLRPTDAEWVYVTMPGFLVEALKPGDKVAKGDVVARLANPEIALAVEKARGERDQQQLHLENLRRQAVNSAIAADQIPAAEAALADLDKQLAERQTDDRRLTLIAPISGEVLPPPTVADPHVDDALPRYSGTPLDAANRTAALESGEQVCQIGNSNQVEALLLVDQADVDLVQPGQRVSLEVLLYPGDHFSGEIVELSPAKVDEVPRELLPRGEVPTREAAKGERRTISTVYQARVKLDAYPERFLIGSTGDARIHVAPQSLAERCMRLLSNTFRVKL